MIEILAESESDLVACRISGFVDDADFDGYEEWIRQATHEGLGQIRTVIVLDGFQGWTLKGLWRRIRLNYDLMPTVACVAVVGPEGDAEIYGNLTATMGSFPVEVFRPEQYENALTWSKKFQRAPSQP
jgi:hypothetical protein